MARLRVRVKTPESALMDDLNIRWYLNIRAHKHVAVATVAGFTVGMLTSALGSKLWHLVFD